MTPIPNTFQTPNIYVDRAMQYLGCDELRCLLFATRHILGWKDRVDERTAKISLTMFEKGFKTGKGEIYAGCGLSRPAIKTALDGLVEFGFFIRIGDAGNDGQEWKLGTEIDWPNLECRYAKSVEKKREKVAKAAKASGEKRRKSSTTDVPASSTTHVPPSQYDPRTTTGTTDVPPGGTTDVPKQTQEENTLTNPEKSVAASRARKSTNKHPELIYAVKESLIKAMAYNPADINPTLERQLFKVASELVNCENPVLPDEVSALITFAKQGEKNFKIWYIAPKVADWRTGQRAKKPPSSPGVVSPNGSTEALKPETIRFLENQRKQQAEALKKASGQ